MSNMRRNILVASGNQNVFPADQDIFNEDGSTNVNKGQIAIWNVDTYRSIGPGTTVSDADRIVISVGYDRYNLRANAGETFFGNSVQAVKASAPSFGAAHVVDLLYNVTDVGDAFTINVQVRDNETENQFPFNRAENLTFTVKRDEISCEDCDGGIDSTKLSCLLRDRINQGKPENYKKQSIYLNKDFSEDHEFTAHVLFGAGDTATPTTFQYCVNPVNTGDCETCQEGDVVFHSFAYTDSAGATQTQEFSFVNNAAGDAVMLDRLQAVVDQINAKIGIEGTKNGSAVIVKGVGACAPYVIEVNTCDSAFVINSAVATPIDPCNGAGSGTNPFADPYSEINDCPACGAGSTDISFLGGLRFVAKPVEIPTKRDFDPLIAPKGYLVRELEVFPTDGFQCSKTLLRTIQKPLRPENLGYEWAWEEYTSSNGGRGRTHDQWNSNVGAINVPLERSRVYGNVTDPKETYCPYTIAHSMPRREQSVHGQMYATKLETVVLIPSGDSVTIADFEAILNPYVASSGVPNIKAVACNVGTTQQDQVENTDSTVRYPDSNGRIV